MQKNGEIFPFVSYKMFMICLKFGRHHSLFKCALRDSYLLTITRKLSEFPVSMSKCITFSKRITSRVLLSFWIKANTNLGLGFDNNDCL